MNILLGNYEMYKTKSDEMVTQTPKGNDKGVESCEDLCT